MIGKTLKILINSIVTLFVIFGVFVIFSLVPLPGNLKIFSVQSGSMSPAIKTGSLIFVKPMQEYKLGDVITRHSLDQKTVTHRIIYEEEIDGKIFFETKGDANNAADGAKVAKEDIIGKKIWGIPLVGYLVSYAKTGPGIILIIIVPALIIIYDEGKKIRLELRKIVERKINKEYYEKHPEAKP